MNTDETPIVSYLPATIALRRIGYTGRMRTPADVMKALTKSSVRYLPPRVAGTKTFILVNEQDVEAQEARMMEVARIKKENLKIAQASLEEFKVQSLNLDKCLPTTDSIFVRTTQLLERQEKQSAQLDKIRSMLQNVTELLANHIDAPHKGSEG
jgi:hypothetical protein